MGQTATTDGRPYGDVLAALDQRGLATALLGGGIYVGLPGDRHIVITAAHGDLPADPADRVGWCAWRAMPGRPAPIASVYLSKKNDVAALVDAVGRHAAQVRCDLAAAQARNDRGQQRKCPVCNHHVDDVLLDDEPCHSCQATI
jgi:hypothetical protein